MTTTPRLEQFRIEISPERVAHLVFDMPGRSMNVFSNAAIHELGAFARWLKQSDVRGAVIRSGKKTAFCAGADLGELGEAYTMIMAAPVSARHKTAFDHFFPLSTAIRGIETSGKPVAAAIEGLALGGGCELALGAHYRVLADTPRASLGLPESLVGLLPGAGGTQRMPRLVGVDLALPILLDGGRLSGEAAINAGLADEIAASDSVVQAAEDWVLRQTAPPLQPWDRGETRNPGEAWRAAVKAKRDQVLAATLGHEPAPIAILDCIERGLPLAMDDALAAEMDIFSHLIQRREPRNMIRTLFVGRQERDRAIKAGGAPREAAYAATQLGQLIREKTARDAELAAALWRAGFKNGAAATEDVAAVSDYWFEIAPDEPRKAKVRILMNELISTARDFQATMSAEHQRIADLILVEEYGFPAHLGGPFGLAEERRN